MSPRRVETLLGAGIVTVFLLVRLALLVVREPFFDELFTVWLAQKPFAEILPALRLDSGPPLYYLLARVPNVLALRALSLLFATTAMALVLANQTFGRARFIAAALLAIYPPAVLFAVDARAYALCGLLIGIATIALQNERRGVATVALVLAAYTHYYGILFLPLLVVRRAFKHAMVAAVLVGPAIWLASIQPMEAMRWLSESNASAPLRALAFVGGYEPALFAPAPMVLAMASAVAVVIAVSGRGMFSPFVLIPIGLAIASALAGRPVYFPMRFESVLAVPLVLWIAMSLERWRRDVRWVLTAALVILGALTVVRGTVDHARRETDPYREAAHRAGRLAQPNERVVATGYLFLETAVALPDRHVEAWPAEQALHPGWRATKPADATRLPRSSFVWIGERAAPESEALRRARSVQPLWMNERAVIVRVASLDR